MPAIVTVLLSLVLAAPQAATPAAQTSSRLGQWTGRVEIGMMAIGGESTGMHLVADSVRLELRAEGAIATRLERLEGRQVTVRGRLDERPGVEIAARRIVTVTGIRQPQPWTERPSGVALFLAYSRPELESRVNEKVARLPAAIRAELNRRILQRRAHASKTPALTSGLPAIAASMARARHDLEAALVGFAGLEAAAEAAAYAKAARLFYEWEGFPDGPMDEATFAETYITQHPASVLRPYLELFQLHRLRAAFEAGGFSAAFPPVDSPGLVGGFASAEREAARKYQALWPRVSQSPDALVRTMAVDIDDELYVNVDIAAHPRGASRGK
jgi:hypothetical protein